LEIKKKQILNRLDQEGLFEPNKVCRVPALPLHIGLVTSADSAAYNDFVKTLRLSGFGFKIYLADAAMQGERTQATVLKALETLQRLPMDVVVIIRGGGSKTDLFYLDNETIARRIAAFKHPVWTGIGHEIDVGVLDYVANRAFKTPTAVAEALVVRFREMAAHLETAQNRFRTTWAYRRETALRYLLERDAGIRQGTRKLLDISIAALGGKANQLSSLVTKRLSGEKARLAVAERVLSTAPLTVMQQSKALVLEWERRIRNLGQRLLLERGASLHRLALRFRQERFARQLIDQQAWVQDCKIRLMHVFKRRMLAYQHEQDRFSKKFRLGYVLKPLLAEQNALNAKSSTLKAYDPQNSLKRGFALLYTIDGQLITSVQGIRAGQPTQTTLYDGQVISTVERIEGTLK
jgi:exodeoxyribonuclease VII large subunit